MASIVTRALDVVIASLVLFATAPILAAAMVAIYLYDRHTPIFRRRVLGIGGKPFDAYKLRTMTPNAELFFESDGALREEYERRLKLRSDPRVTPVGRFLRKYSIDELPQLLNVVRGQMALVGPRMIHTAELHRFGDLGPVLLAMKPGLTGLWQVSGRQELTFEERLVLDARYARTRSLRLDLVILVRTFPAIISARGAY